MRSRFMARVATVVFGIVTFLLLDAALTGGLSFIGALCLIPAALYVTAAFAEAALRPKRRRRRPATRPVPQQPAAAHGLRVVKGSGTGTKPPNAA